MGELVCIAQACLACVSLSLFSDPDRPTDPSTSVKWRLPEPFIAQGRAAIMSPGAQ
jgi:hypothetical protein